MRQAVARTFQKRNRNRQLARFGPQQGLVHVRRQARFAPFVEQLAGKALVIVAHHRAVQRMLHVTCLHQHLGRRPGPPCPPRHLHQLREQALAGAVVLREQRRIRVQDTHQRQLLEVMALGDHLGADQDIDLAPVHAVERRLRAALQARGVGIDAQDARLGEHRPQAFFDALRAPAQRLDVDVAAGRA